ncbi:uncharacterized protein [Dermacentor albipictus]|uniref:uncharacterized protein isoform X1 n=1 Tax=Dermacentor albipictus TaxID=60249 RepID=UPI0031FE351C
MCWGSTKTTLLLVSLVCICMNGFNLTSRFLKLQDKLREHEIAAYIPDVTDISSWVNGRKTSDEITMGLASVSLIFDAVLLTGAARENGLTIQIAGLWGSIDCVIDGVIGFLSANYTLPVFRTEERTVKSAVKSVRRQHRALGWSMHQILKTEKKETRVELREPPPTTVKQLLHFAWVILRLIIKSQILCSLFGYVQHLSRRDEIVIVGE